MTVLSFEILPVLLGTVEPGAIYGVIVAFAFMFPMLNLL
jgi:hypothetical protein